MTTQHPPIPTAAYGSSSQAPRCLYCGSEEFDALYSGVQDRLRHVPGEHTFWRCRQCESAILVPMPAEHELAAFYPEVYSFTPDTPQTSRVKRWLAQLEYNIFFQPQYFGQALQVLNHIGRRPAGSRKLLDIGCGRGLRLLEYRKRGWEVHGADLQPEVVQYLNEKLQIPAKTCGFSEVEQHYTPESFDLVTSYFTFEHIPDVASAFRGCYQLTKPGGWVAVIVPLGDSAQARFFAKQWIQVTEAPRHLSLPSLTGIETVCRNAGFQKVKTLHDHALSCGGSFALSLVPDGNSTNLYGSKSLWPIASRALLAAMSFAGIAAAFFDRWQGNIPAHGLVLGQKPLS